MELFVGDIAEHGSVSYPCEFCLRNVAAQIDDIDVFSRQILQCLEEQCSRGHVRRGERIADKGHFMGRCQTGERLRPDKPKDRLLDEAGLRQNWWYEHGFRFEMTADLRIAETDAAPLMVVRNAVDRDRTRITQFRSPVDRSAELQQLEKRVGFQALRAGDGVQ